MPGMVAPMRVDPARDTVSEAAPRDWRSIDVGHPLPMPLPLRHLAISPDGSRRWARARGLPPEAGYLGAPQRIVDLLDAAHGHGIPFVSIHVMNRSNWARPAAESGAVMDAVADLAAHLEHPVAAGTLAVTWVGHRDRVPHSVAEALTSLGAKSRAEAPLNLALYVDYDAQHELREAGGDLNHLAPIGYPPVDLFVRTSSDQRSSGFDPLRLANAELLYVLGGFPEFGPEQLRNAIAEYRRRDRRLGR